jgi:hypothetical protein
LGRAKVAGEAGHNAVGKAIGLSIFIANAYFMTRFFVFLILSSTASSPGAGIGPFLPLRVALLRLPELLPLALTLNCI